MSTPHDPSARSGPGLPTIDMNEYGGKDKSGEKQKLDRRLFMQLLAFDVRAPQKSDEVARGLVEQIRNAKIPAVVYADANHPRRVGLLTWSQDPAHFVTQVRPLFATSLLESARLRPELTMIGRTYSTGHEPDLAFTLLERPIGQVTNERYPWHVWYPLRRTGSFARLEPSEQGGILREHAQIGMAYGAQELASDVRLACHGIDANDNEFVIGLVGPRLENLSHLVQTMRKTKQTSEFIQSMGPFFVGHVVGRS